MLNRIFSIILAAFFVVSITGCYDAGAVKIDAQVMPKIDGCTLERFEVVPRKNTNVEILYVARCEPQKTTTTSVVKRCGKHCVQRVTTVTEIVGEQKETQ